MSDCEHKTMLKYIYFAVFLILSLLLPFLGLINYYPEVFHYDPESLPSVMWLDPKGNIEERIQTYQKLISDIRYKIWNKRGRSQWKDLAKEQDMEELDAFFPVFQTKLTNVTSTITVYLTWRGNNSTIVDYPWSDSNHQNQYLQQYYGWAADEKLCDWVQRRGKVDVGWAYTFYCFINRSNVLEESHFHLQNYYSNQMYSAIWHRKLTKKNLHLPQYVTYINIFQDVYIDNDATIFADRWKIYLFACTWKMKIPLDEDYQNSTLYSEVFSIAQVFAGQVYHRSLDQLPRLALYLTFLKKHPKIPLHTGGDKSDNTLYLLRQLGLQNQIITGPVRVRVLYAPESIPCGYINVPGTQALFLQYQHIISTIFIQQNRTSIVVIRRSTRSRRYLVEQDAAEGLLQRYGEKYGLKIELFSDKKLPTIEETMKLFNRAVLVFGVHGAGLSNIMFSRPGTWVIEVLASPRATKMCFQRLASIIGHRYYGIAGTNKRNITIDISHLENIVQYFMPHIASVINIP